MKMNSTQTNKALWERRLKAIPQGVASATTAFIDRGVNAELWDIEDNRYIDFGGGIAVMNTGHVHPDVTAAVEKQIHKVSHTAFQVSPYVPYIEVCEKLNKLAPIKGAAKSILFSTGAEAVENAIKIARAYTKRSGVIAFVGGFHGRTLGTLALTGKVAPYKAGFGPFINDVYHAPFPIKHHGISVADSIHAIKNIFKSDIEAERVAAIILEPIQGEGGFYAAPAEFMQALREICDEHGIMLIADEVQSGIARTGKMFAMEHYDVKPDLMTVAKSIASGYPLSAVVGRAKVMDAPLPGGLGGTYAGNPVACAAALAVFEVIRKEKLLDRSNLLGKRIVSRLRAIKKTNKSIGDIRTVGAMTAFEIVDKEGHPDPVKTKALTTRALEHGLILLSCGIYGNTIRILVPLTVTDKVLKEGLDMLEKSLKKL